MPASAQNRPKSPRPTSTTHARTSNRRVDTPPTTYAGRWNEPIDFDQPLTPNEQQQKQQQQRVAQPSSTSTPDFDFLIDTSDTIKKPVEDPTIYKASRQSAGMELSSIWQDMSDLNASSSTTTESPHHHQQQQQAPESSDSHSEADGGDGILQPTKPIVDNNSLLDTSEDLMSTTSTLSQRPPDSTTGTMTPLVPERISSTSQSKRSEEPSKESAPTPSPSPPSPPPPQSDVVQKDEKEEEKKESESSSPSPKSIIYRVNLSLGGSQEQSVLVVYEVCRR